MPSYLAENATAEKAEPRRSEQAEQASGEEEQRGWLRANTGIKYTLGAIGWGGSAHLQGSGDRQYQVRLAEIQLQIGLDAETADAVEKEGVHVAGLSDEGRGSE